jgi:hypothetical protein
VKRALLALAFAACGGGEEATPKVEPGSATKVAEPAITAKLVGCSAALPAPSDPRAIAGESGIGGSWGAPVGGRAALLPRVKLEAPAVHGDLSPAIVRRYLRRHLVRFQYCYEKEIVAKPDLAGGVIEMAFAIQSSGAVASATANGVDLAVSTCVANALRQIEYPKPQDGAQVQVAANLVLENPNAAPVQPASPPRRQRPTKIANEWTPFAAESIADAETARFVIKPVADGVTERLPAIDTCFDGAKGAVRVIITLATTGFQKTARAGGLGDTAIESCIAAAVSEVAGSLLPEVVEVACDITRGGDAPLRVSPDAGYLVVEVTPTELRSTSGVREIPPKGTRGATMLGNVSSVLVVAEPDAPAHGIAAALHWAPITTTLVAVKASGGAPVFVGMGDTRVERVASTDKRVVQLRTDKGRMRACVPGSTLDDSAPLLDPRAMDRVMEAVRTACASTACEPTIVVGTTGEFIAKDLVATTSAARRAGFHAISIGGPACD